MRVSGSPPQTWGRRQSGGRGLRLCRFTPTDVGKTPGWPNRGRNGTVHPHRRGEDPPRQARGVDSSGSPPQTWGRRKEAVLNGQSMEVHPHRRGEDFRPPRSPPLYRGSPPQTWGRRDSPSKMAVSARFTPTDVGKTIHLALETRNDPVHPHRRGEDGSDGRRDQHRPGSPPQTWGRPKPRRRK